MSEETSSGRPLPQAVPNDQIWQIARSYLSTIGEPSALFSGCCRSLAQGASGGSGTIGKLASARLARLLRSPSMLAQIFYAAKTYWPQEIESRKTIEPADFVFFIPPADLALIIAIGYTTHRIAKQLDAQDWELLWDPFQRCVDLAVPLGSSIPAIGSTKALMTAAGKFMGWGLFNLKNADSYKKYRVSNKVQKRPFSLKEETEIFGTTHLHISSLIFQNFGFGVATCEQYLGGLTEPVTHELSSAETSFRVTRLWLDSLVETAAPPAQSLGDDYDLNDKSLEKLVSTVQILKQKGSELKWLRRNREDVDTEKTPELLADYEGMKAVLKRRGRM